MESNNPDTYVSYRKISGEPCWIKLPDKSKLSKDISTDLLKAAGYKTFTKDSPEHTMFLLKNKVFQSHSEYWESKEEMWASNGKTWVIHGTGLV
jgi:hypothetical protein